MNAQEPRRTHLIRLYAILAVVAALAMFGPFLPDRAAAETTLPGTISVTKSEYMRICRQTGGNPIEQNDGSVTCFYPDGSWSRCWFDTGVCQDSPAVSPRPDIITVPPPANLAETDPAPPFANAPESELDQASPVDRGIHKLKSGKDKKGDHRGKARRR